MTTATAQSALTSRAAQTHAANSFIVNVGTVLGGQAANILVALLLEICYARLLGPGPRGQISLCMMTIAFGALLGGLGADIPIVIWRADRKRNISDWILPVLLWGLLGCAIFNALWWAAYFWWRPEFLRGFTPQLFRLALITVPCAVLFTYTIAMMTGAERFRERATMGIVVSAGGLCSFLALTLGIGRNAEAALWGNCLGIVAGLVVAGIFLRKDFREREKTRGDLQLGKGLLTGLRGQAGNVAAFFNYRLDVFIVNYFLDAPRPSDFLRDRRGAGARESDCRAADFWRALFAKYRGHLVDIARNDCAGAGKGGVFGSRCAAQDRLRIRIWSGGAGSDRGARLLADSMDGDQRSSDRVICGVPGEYDPASRCVEASASSAVDGIADSAARRGKSLLASMERCETATFVEECQPNDGDASAVGNASPLKA